MLNGIQRALIDQGCRSVRNFGRLEQADDLNTTLGRVYRKLLNVGRLFQQRLIDLDLPSSLSEFVQELALDGVHIQPPNVTNHVNSITIGLKAMIDSVSTAAGGSVQFAGPVDYIELNHCAQYIMRRIKALGQQRVNYPSDVDPVEAFPQDDPRVPVLNGSEEEDKEGKEEEEQDFAETYVPYFDLDQLLLPDDEIDPEVHAWVSDSDDSCDQHDDDDNIMAQDILIRGLINLQYIRNFPKKYSHCQYYIIASFCFAGIPELLHGIREESEKLSWLWVSNMERLRQAYDIRATCGHICLDLDAIRKLLHCGQIDQVLVDSLAGSLMHLDFTSTSLQPHFIRYFVDNIAIGLQDFLSAIPSDAAVVWAAEPPYLDDLAVLKSHLNFVTERVDALENQHVYYLKNIKRPELLPPLPGPAPLPFASP